MRASESGPFDEHDGVAADRFAAADVADLLAGLGLHADRVDADAEQPGEVGADGGLDRAEFRLLGEDRSRPR